MKRYIFFLFLLVLISAGIIVFLNQNNSFSNIGKKQQNEENILPKIKSEHDKKKVLPLLEGDLYGLIGGNSDKLLDKLGEPKRKDMTPYGYVWWVYTNGVTQYIQFGVQDNKVITAFATGEDISSEPITIGVKYDEINEVFPFKNKVEYHDGLSFYNFLLKDTDLATDPLIKLSDDLFVQCYFDTFTNKLSAIRLLTGETLLKQRLYEMEYRGSLPEMLTFNDDEWEEIEDGMENQVFDMTNVYRNRFDVPPLIKDEQVEEVAFLHSKDMENNNYFSHYGQDGSGLKERLAEKNIYYLSAGENIAAQHTDAPAAIEGWLNSEGHREALLNDEYTHLGVGIYRMYYTQNFLFKP